MFVQRAAGMRAGARADEASDEGRAVQSQAQDPPAGHVSVAAAWLVRVDLMLSHLFM